MPALKTSATLRETRVNTADLAPSARLSVDMLAEALEARHALSKGRDAADWWLLTPEGKRKWQTRAQWLIDFMREA